MAESIYLDHSLTFQRGFCILYLWWQQYMDSPLINIFYPLRLMTQLLGVWWKCGFDTLSQKILQTYDAAGQMVTDTIQNWNDSAQVYFYGWYDTITYNNIACRLL